MRNAAIGLVIVALALFGMASLPFVSAQNQTAKGLVEGMLQDILSSEGRRVLVDGVSISLDGDVTATRIEVQDDAGSWLVLEKFALDWQPLSLLSDSLKIDSLSVERINVERLPNAAETEGDGAPVELKNLKDAVIEKVAIANLELSEQVAGTKFIFAVDGSGRIKQTPAEVSLELEAQRIDGGDSRLTANMLLDPVTRVVNVDLQLKEGRDGLIVNLLDIANQPPVDLSVSAKGSIDDWAGEFGLKLDERTVAQGTAQLDTEPAGKRLTLDAEGEIGRLVSERFAGWLGGSTQLVGSVLFEKDRGRADVQRIRIGNNNVQLRASGPVDWADDTSDLTVEFRSDATHPLIIADQPGTLGRAQVSGLNGDLHITGTIANPDWQFKGSAREMTSDPAVLKQLSVELRGAGIDFSEAGTDLSGSVSAEVSRGKSRVMPAALIGPFRANLAAQTNEQGQIVISDTAVSAGVVNFALEGNLKAEDGAFDLGFKADAQSPETGYTLLDRLLAGDAALSGRLASDGGGRFDLTDWRIVSRTLALNLSGRVDKTVDLTLAGQISDLSQLHEEASGAAELQAKVSGARAAPLLTLQARGENVTLVGAALSDPDLKVEMTLSETAPEGQLNLTATLEDRPVSARALLATTADGTRELREVSVVSGSARLNGRLSLPVSGVPTGRFDLTAPDLGDVGPLLLMRLRGRLNAQIDLTDVDNQSALRAVFEGAGIEADSFAAAKASGDIQVKDLLGRPRVQGQAGLRKVRAADMSFEEIKATAESTGENAYAVELDVSGRDLSARALADVKIDGDQVVVNVSKLAGKAQQIAFGIAGPFTLTQDESGAVRVNKAALKIGKGRVSVDGQVSPDLDAKVALKAVPLRPFELLAGVPGLRGSVSGRANVKGALDAPVGDFELSGQRLTADDLRAQGLGGLQVAVSGRMANRKVSLRGTVKGGNDVSANLQGQIDLARTPLSFDLRASGKVGTRLLADRVAEAGARLAGRLGFDITVRGTAERPEVQGTLTLSDATVGDLEGRFVVTRASGRFEISKSQVRIVSFAGRMGKSGSVSASGTVGLDDALPANVRVQVQNGVYADGTLVRARYDANLSLRGSLAGTPLLQGDIILKKTSVTLSEVPPAALKPIDVRHKRAPANVLRQSQKIRARSGGGGADIRLDLRIVASQSISVSGRGITALLGGSLRISGTPAALVTEGSFTLRRGVLKLLGQRLEFESGRLDFDGDLDPRLNLVAVSRTSDSTIRLLIAGRASAPQISVTSSPELPEEEALARLVFNRDLLQLAPLQIAQLAASIAVLSGGSDNSLLGGLQDTLGVDWLEVTETPSGETAVGAGKQLNERLSIGVEQTTKTNTSRVIIDLGISKNFKLRGAAGSDGSSRAGVFFEKDY